MSGVLVAPILFLLQVVLGFAIAMALLRFLLQLLRASFFNPLSQFVVRLTEPPLRPLRRWLPATRRIDSPSLLAAWAIQSLELAITFWLQGAGPRPLFAALLGIAQILDLIFTLFIVALVAGAILSWLPQLRNPATALLYSFTEPVLSPVRRRLPPLSGIDLSPLVAIALLFALKLFIVGLFTELARALAG